MKWQLRCFCLFLCAFVLVSCAAVDVSPQPAPLGDINSIIESPLPTVAPLTFPQMTGTAEAIPTVIYPTETPLSPEEILDLSQWKATSPDGNYVITCDTGFPVLFHAPTKTVIASTDRSFGCDSQRSAWSPDSSYVFLVERGAENLYRWRVDGSQPEFLAINKIVEPKKLNYPGCNVTKMSWSPDGRYLAIHQCGLYVVTPADEETFKYPLLIAECAGCVEDFRWATSYLLMIDYFRSYSFIHIPTGKDIGSWGRSGGVGCAGQPPFISPDELWVVFDQCWAGGGVPFYDQYALANMNQGSVDIFSEVAGDRVEFISWKPDSSEFYMVSRPTKLDSQADPRTPFGLLALNPKTLQIRNLFEQAWYISFNKDFAWGYVVFPGRNANGNFGLDGGLWQVGTSELVAKQVMAIQIDEKFLNPYKSRDTGSMYSATGKELGFSSDTLNRPLPAAWSHDNTRVAIINTNHQLVVIDLQGEIQTIAQLGVLQEWLYSEIQWSDDDRSIVVDGVTWTVP